MSMFERMSYIPQFLDTYETELGWVEYWANDAAATVQKKRAELTRGDGSPVYAAAEMEERETAILEKVATNFDNYVAKYADKAAADAEKLEKELARLEGSDGYERLTESQRQTAASRREFVKEDAQTLPSTELVKRARASIAAGNLAEAWLLRRYISERVRPADADGMPVVRATGSRDLELVTVVRELGALFGDEDRAARKKEIEAKLRAAKSFPLALSTARNMFDGSSDRAREQQRQHMLSRF